MKYIWVASFPSRLEGYFESAQQVKDMVLSIYSSWEVKPWVEIEREDYIAFRVANGDLIEAFRKQIGVLS